MPAPTARLSINRPVLRPRPPSHRVCFEPGSPRPQPAQTARNPTGAKPEMNVAPKPPINRIRDASAIAGVGSSSSDRKSPVGRTARSAEAGRLPEDPEGSDTADRQATAQSVWRRRRGTASARRRWGHQHHSPVGWLLCAHGAAARTARAGSGPLDPSVAAAQIEFPAGAYAAAVGRNGHSRHPGSGFDFRRSDSVSSVRSNAWEDQLRVTRPRHRYNRSCRRCTRAPRLRQAAQRPPAAGRSQRRC